MDRYWAEPYVQHSPQMLDGLDTLRAAVPGLQGFSWEPQRVAAQGDLVFTHSIVHGWAPGPVVIVDIFRLETVASSSTGTSSRTSRPRNRR